VMELADGNRYEGEWWEGSKVSNEST